ncbi:MAG: (d)CMP kinase [Chloroflexi bacterium]|nr:MAG: (d)CMP kinase [Chloroflexota bacterium]
MSAERRKLVVALDGPASSGKSSVGAAAAPELGYRFCDTGLLYRAVTWLGLRERVDPAAGSAAVAELVQLADEVHLAPDAQGRLDRVVVDGRDGTDELHTAPVDEKVSDVSAIPEVRAALQPRQRALAREGGIVMAGRDIGTVILPDADLKIFLDASVEERGRRRAEERGVEANSQEGQAILAQLRRRDDLDRNRPVAPLRAASDAHVLRTDGNRFDQTVGMVVREILEAERTATAAGASA